MGAGDMLGGNFNADEARYAYNNRTQTPDFAPGQDAVFSESSSFSDSAVTNSGGMGDLFSSGTGFGTTMGSPFDANVGLGGIPSGNSFQQSTAQQPQQQKSAEDMFFDAVVAGGKSSVNLLKDLQTAFKLVTPRYYSECGRNIGVVGVIVAGVSVVLQLFGLGFGLKLAMGGLVSAAIGVVTWGCMTESAKAFTSKYKDENNTMQSITPQPVQNGFNTMGDSNMGFSPAPAMGFDDGWDDDSSDNLDDFSVPDEDEDEDDYDYGGDEDDYEDMIEEQGQDGMDSEEALNSLPDIPASMYTRQYLYDALVKKLPTITPGFHVIKHYDESDDLFIRWSEILDEAAESAGCKEDYYPELTGLEENLFTIKVTCTKPQGLKLDKLANEMAGIYAFKDGERNENVYATYDSSGLSCYITIYTGESALISLKDMYGQIKDEILNSKYYMPVVIGVDQTGKVIWHDFKKIESCIVAGMPRSGKSWLVQAILTQMCAFVPPSELNFYIFDPKAGTSDFKAFTLPHVKKFASRYKNETGTIVNPESIDILDTLTYIVRVEAPRRKKLLGDAGVVNIWDFRKKYPDVELPLLYIIIDEAVTLAEDMEKEVKKQYQSYVTQLITQFPNLGIRAFLIPHVVKDQIIKKTATDSVKCRISVKGSPDHIESSTGTKSKDFTYKLCNVGDMAVNMPDISPKTLFVHGVAITDDNEKNNEVFDYLRRVWGKIEPTCLETEAYKSAEEKKETDELLASLQEDSPAVVDSSNSFDDDFNFSEDDLDDDDGFSLF